jgi:hypothetical protein
VATVIELPDRLAYTELTEVEYLRGKEYLDTNLISYEYEDEERLLVLHGATPQQRAEFEAYLSR